MKSRQLKNINIFSTFMILVLVQGAFAVTVHDVDIHVESIASRVYSTRHGLPSNGVETVFQDDYGFIWACTQEGVARYDGQGFTVFDHFPENTSTHVISSVVDSENRYWFGTMRGLNVLSESGIQKVDLGQKNRLMVNKIVIDASNDIWITSNLTGPYRINSENLKIVSSEPALKGLAVNGMVADPAGVVWVATTGGLYRQHGDEFVPFLVKGYEGIAIEALWLDDSDSGYFAVYPGKIVRFSPDGVSEIKLCCQRGSINVFCFAGSSGGGIWIGSDKGLFLWEDQSVARFTVDTGLSSNMIQSLIIDREGLLWYGSDNGLGKIAGLQFRQIIPSRDLPLSSIFDMGIDDIGRKWFGTNEGLTVLDGTQVKTWTSADGFRDDYVVAIRITSQGRLLAANGQQLFELKDEKIEPVPDAVFSSVMDILEDPHGCVWIVDSNEIYTLTPDGIEANSKQLGIPVSADLVTGFFDNRNKMWILTDSHGCFRITPEDDSIVSIDNLPSHQVYSICQDQRDDIWLGTLDGAVQLEDTSIRIILNEKQGMASGSVWTVYPDSQNNMWFSTSRGLSCLKNGKICNYDVEDGLSGDDLITNCVLTDELGRIWFGGTGVTIVNPRVDLPVIAPRTYVKWALINGEKLEPGDRIPYGNNTFEFNILCQSYINENRNMFRYQLKGFDPHRSQPTRSGYVRYTNLNSGRYQLIAESRNRDGIWSEEPAIFDFEVLPAWWELYWVHMLMGFTLIGLIVVTARARSATIRRRAIRLENEVDRQTAIIKTQ